jgi:hypothetical protein
MENRCKSTRFLFTVLFLFFGVTCFSKEKLIKPRIILTADPELDDNNSLIRFLLYSNEMQIEGLVYASSQFHWKGDGKGTKFMVKGREYTRYGLNLCPCESYRWKKDERFIHDAVEAYEKVYDNLRKHDSEFPKPSYLQSVIRYGNIEFEGDFTKDTEGSNLIRAAILDDKPGPLFITAWGGQSTIARALKSIGDEYKQKPEWDAIYQKVSSKVVILPSGDQDGTYASYIQIHWPKIDYRQYRSGPRYGYGAQLNASPENAKLLTPEWMQKHIRSKGPLGELYRVWGDGKRMVEGDIFDYFGMQGYTSEQLKKLGYIVWMPVQAKGSWLGEGDTGTFMNILGNGLNAYEKENPGGWGGRPFYPDLKTYVDPFSNDTSKNKDLVISAETVNRRAEADNAIPFPNFFPAAQHDFAARMHWSVSANYSEANHAPRVEIKGAKIIQAKIGETISVKATVSDPDGNGIVIKWWQFVKVKGETTLTILNPTSAETKIQIPKDAKMGNEYHVVAEVTDDGKPTLTRYALVKIRL